MHQYCGLFVFVLACNVAAGMECTRDGDENANCAVSDQTTLLQSRFDVDGIAAKANSTEQCPDLCSGMASDMGWKSVCVQSQGYCAGCDQCGAKAPVGVWSLIASKYGCSNYASNSMAPPTTEASADDCGSKCANTPGCVGFGYQSGSPSSCTKGGGVRGTCDLWKGPCEHSYNPCWDDYSMKALWTLSASGYGCSNFASVAIGPATTEASVDDCGMKCQDAPGCVGFNFQSGSPSSCTKGGGVQGSCTLFNGACHHEINPCWDDYVMKHVK